MAECDHDCGDPQCHELCEFSEKVMEKARKLFLKVLEDKGFAKQSEASVRFEQAAARAFLAWAANVYAATNVEGEDAILEFASMLSEAREQLEAHHAEHSFGPITSKPSEKPS